MFIADLGDSAQRGANEVFTWLPRLAAFIVILIVGYFVAKLVASALGRLLSRAGFDRTAMKGKAGDWIGKATSSPSRLIGTIAFWAIFIGAISIALDALGIQALDDFVGAVWAYLPNVIAAFLIFLVAGAIAAGVGALVARTMGDTPTGKVIGTVVPILIMAVAGFMILDQLKIAETIVTITYASLLGAIALGMALAFGLGGRDVAARMLEGAYQAGQQNREQIKQDLQQGREQAESEVRDKIEGDEVSSPLGETEAEPVEFEPEEQLTREMNRPTGA
jgi:Mechanosensitive ion channel, conserved TM helix